MIVLRSPKGWTGPKEVDGQKVEDFWRSHQVPVSNARGNAEHRKILEEWMRSYRPEELFDAGGKLLPDIAALAPEGDKRMGAQPLRQWRPAEEGSRAAGLEELHG